MDDYMLKTKNLIWVTFQREGIHRYPEASTNPELADVSFLGNDHRHIFHFRVEITVNHNNRDIEFLQFKRWLKSLYDDNILQLEHRSCEMMADELAEKIQMKYPGRTTVISVSEDNENGCVKTYEYTYLKRV
jgi:hypothetical protein